MNAAILILAVSLAKITLGLALILWSFPWLWDVLSPALGGPVREPAV